MSEEPLPVRVDEERDQRRPGVLLRATLNCVLHDQAVLYEAGLSPGPLSQVPGLVLRRALWQKVYRAVLAANDHASFHDPRLSLFWFSRRLAHPGLPFLRLEWWHLAQSSPASQYRELQYPALHGRGVSCDPARWLSGPRLRLRQATFLAFSV